MALFACLNKVSPAECHSSWLAIFRFDHYNSVWHVATLAAMVIRLYADVEFTYPRVNASPDAFAGVRRPIAPLFSYYVHGDNAKHSAKGLT